jgi:hypothetical protein
MVRSVVGILLLDRPAMGLTTSIMYVYEKFDQFLSLMICRNTQDTGAMSEEPLCPKKALQSFHN